MRPRTIKSCRTAVILDRMAVPVPGLSLNYTARIARTTRLYQNNIWRHSQGLKPGDAARKTDQLATLPKTKPSPTDLADWKYTIGWKPPFSEIGDRWRFSAYWYQILLYHHPKNRNSGLETQSRLEANSHKKLAIAPLPRWFLLTLNDPSPTTTSWTFSHELVTNHHRGRSHGRGGGPRVYSFARNSNRTRLKLYATLLVFIIQPLIQPIYRFLGQNLGWKRDWDNFIPKHADSDIAILTNSDRNQQENTSNR